MLPVQRNTLNALSWRAFDEAVCCKNGERENQMADVFLYSDKG